MQKAADWQDSTLERQRQYPRTLKKVKSGALHTMPAPAKKGNYYKAFICTKDYQDIL